jgi:hypothetical protein
MNPAGGFKVLRVQQVGFWFPANSRYRKTGSLVCRLLRIQGTLNGVPWRRGVSSGSTSCLYYNPYDAMGQFKGRGAVFAAFPVGSLTQYLLRACTAVYSARHLCVTPALMSQPPVLDPDRLAAEPRPVKAVHKGHSVIQTADQKAAYLPPRTSMDERSLLPTLTAQPGEQRTTLELSHNVICKSDERVVFPFPFVLSATCLRLKPPHPRFVVLDGF